MASDQRENELFARLFELRNELGGLDNASLSNQRENELFARLFDLRNELQRYEFLPSGDESILSDSDESDINSDNDILAMDTGCNDEDLRTYDEPTVIPDSASDFSSDDELPLNVVADLWSWKMEGDVKFAIPPFTEEEGPRKQLFEGAKSPIDFFMTYLEDAFIDVIVEETNRYAKQTARNGAPFIPTTNKEMKAFIGLNILMGIKILPSYRDFWSTNYIMQDSYISNVMTVNRFGWLLGKLHVNDNSKMLPKDNPARDKLHKVRPLVDYLNSKFLQLFQPSKEQAIDESMIKFKGRSSLKQYMPLKPIKRGYKMWVRADRTGHVNEFEIYTGKSEGQEGDRLGEKVVTRLTDTLKGNNHHIYFDNFFTSVPLLTKMVKTKRFGCGTIRANRRDLPPNMKRDTELAKNETDFRIRLNGVSLTTWKDKRVVRILSTIHDQKSEKMVERRAKDGKKDKIPIPVAVIDYNKNMGFVDQADQAKSYYQIDRKSKKYWHRIFWHLIDVTVCNSFLAFQLVTNNEDQTLKDFRLNLVASLCGARKRRPVSGGTSSVVPSKVERYKKIIPENVRRQEAAHLPIHTTSRRCAHCSTIEKPKRSRWQCTLCKVALCLTKEKNCFIAYHK